MDYLAYGNQISIEPWNITTIFDYFYFTIWHWELNTSFGIDHMVLSQN